MRVMIKSFAIGSIRDYGYTLAAIAWQESELGRIPMNSDERSYGVYHNLIKSVMNRVSVKNTSYNRSSVGSRLMSDIDYAARFAILELLFWEKKHTKREWGKVVSSYNGGYSWKKDMPQVYLINIKNKVKILKEKIPADSPEFQSVLEDMQNVWLEKQKEKI